MQTKDIITPNSTDITQTGVHTSSTTVQSKSFDMYTTTLTPQNTDYPHHPLTDKITELNL